MSLSSNNSSEISLPATVTIPFGQSSATFSFSLLQDGLKAGTQNVTVTATAAGLSNSTANISVHDATLDHIAFDALTGNKTAGTTFPVTLRAFNVANETIITYAANATLAATGAGNISIPVSPTSLAFSTGIATANANITIANPAVTLTATSGGATASSATFAVQAGAVASFTWGNVTSPQSLGIPFPESLTAKDAYNNTVTNYNGSANLTGLVGTFTSQTMLGNTTYAISSSGNFTDGYSFTPNTAIQVTAVRSYYGTKVSIWTSSGTLLVSQAVTSPGGVWTETSLSTPLTLSAGVTYVIGLYSGGQTWYFNNTPPVNPSFATIGPSYNFAGDGFPNVGNSAYWPVDIRANIGSGTSVPISPASAIFSNGTSTGNITINQPATAMHLHVDDGARALQRQHRVQRQSSGAHRQCAPRHHLRHVAHRHLERRPRRLQVLRRIRRRLLLHLPPRQQRLDLRHLLHLQQPRLRPDLLLPREIAGHRFRQHRLLDPVHLLRFLHRHRQQRHRQFLPRRRHSHPQLHHPLRRKLRKR